jgi:hypothetical protein
VFFVSDGVVRAVRNRQAAVETGRKRRGAHESRRVAHEPPQRRKRFSGDGSAEPGFADFDTGWIILESVEAAAARCAIEANSVEASVG